MKLFIDSADNELIKKYYGLSIFHGVTTTPTFFLRQGISDYSGEIKKICSWMKGELHLEAMGETVDEIIECAVSNNTLGESIVSKIPMSFESLKSVKALKERGIKTNLHLVFSLNQAVMAAAAGSDYVCLMIGRINDIGGNAFEIVNNTVRVFREYGFQSKIMASSIRSLDDFTKSLLAGVDAITIPPHIIDLLFKHPLTDIGVRTFQKDIILSRTVGKLMKTGNDMPLVDGDCPVSEVLAVMTEKKIGLGIVVNKQKNLEGIITDGDFRRILKKSRDAINQKVSAIMNVHPIVITETMLVSEALALMEEKRITALVVVSGGNEPVGYVNLHDILLYMNVGT